MIKTITIENYKSIRHLELDMKPINILIGANGVGKSNFISFFKFLKNLLEQHLQLYVAEEAGADNILYFGSKHSDFLQGYIEFEINSELTNAYLFKLSPDKENEFYFENETAFFHDSSHYKKPYDISLGQGHRESKRNKESEQENIVFHVKEYMSSFKIFHFHDTSKTSGMRKPAKLDDNIFLREDASNLPAYLYWIQKKHPNIFKRIEMVIRSVAPYFECFNLQPGRQNEDYIKLEWKEKGSDAYFNAKHLSDGTLRFIALTTLLLQPKAPQTIIIDEPELGLHPFAIDKLAALIKKASVNSQIIVSTQSVNLMNNFSPEDIITVDKKDNQSVFKRQNTEELTDWLENYSIGDLWNKNVIGGRP
ncbi:cobalt transporter ATP-binding subunit [Bacteroidales bacterium Barb6XT]|nr:cobalt transporter ATP-binding subunit [Bacteroidales bacterium Barb6XT]